MRVFQAALRQAAAELGLALTSLQAGQLLDYLELLEKWGRVYNLTAVRDPHQMLTQHVLDSLAVIPPLRRQLAQGGDPGGAHVLDVGSGAGLPGVVIAVCCPETSVCCVDAVAKKAAFVRQVALSLKLPNLRGVHARVENLAGKYEFVISRAFASLSDFTAWSGNLLAPGGSWVAMKGKRPDDELANLPEQIEVFHVEPIVVPGLDAQRCLVWMRRRGAH